MDHKITKVVTDTETLLDTYRKRIKDITDKLENIRRFKVETQERVKTMLMSMDKVAMNCD